MCGIAGYVLRDGAPAELPLVRAMCDAIRYRGPDDDGYYAQGSCAIGMRRLSIIDLATGHQPMTNEDRTSWIVFNGEIYNFLDLRPTLVSQGHRFTTHSDTETILHLYEQEGVEGLNRLRGMFAFAIWDARKQELLLVRDRFGKKPLYFAALPQGLFFGSEIKCLQAAGVPLERDPHALSLYLMLGYVPDPWSAFRNVRKLAPGGWLKYFPRGEIREGRFWRLPPPQESAPPGWTEQQAADQVREVFDESVKLRLISDVPLAARGETGCFHAATEGI